MTICSDYDIDLFGIVWIKHDQTSDQTIFARCQGFMVTDVTVYFATDGDVLTSNGPNGGLGIARTKRPEASHARLNEY